jgi:hypothetical protein
MAALSARFVASSALVLAAAFASCSTSFRPRGAANDALVTSRLREVRPIEIAVPPVENHTGAEDLPLDALRQEFQRGLVKRRYTPLALTYVDKNASATEASYRPGALGEQASLRVVLTGWDTSRWRSHSRLVVDADVYLLDAAQPEIAKALWGGHATRTIDLSLQRGNFINDAAMLQRAVELFVDEVLGSLPPRDAESSAK